MATAPALSVPRRWTSLTSSSSHANAATMYVYRSSSYPIISYQSDCSPPCLRSASSSNNSCHLTLQICVWCWHHIIDMAEKEETEGRCPACRTRYDKDRIVKMAATCDRSVAMLLFLPINFCSTSADYNICDDYPLQTTTFAIDYPFIRNS
jgi:DNA-directed RNA polymerase subunit RPC12/RpoP